MEHNAIIMMIKYPQLSKNTVHTVKHLEHGSEAYYMQFIPLKYGWEKGKGDLCRMITSQLSPSISLSSNRKKI